ncbi:MAG: 3-deoxy-manno-octulosonate cytidylyltransferase [Gammaproteobacteria bacterium]|nr:3-deoxy-manno-octulosonate cytidylyltransferase [Gammaproteobacteria bacterium]
MVGFTVIIPARYGSTRLPAKALADIAGVPMVCRVAEAAQRAGAKQVLVACDDARILDACRKHGIKAMLTSLDHKSGTDRVLEAATRLGLTAREIVINVQGDEPRIPAEAIATLARNMDEQELDRATLMQRIVIEADIANPNVVKVVASQKGQALYFSRSPLPYARNAPPDGFRYFRHIGIYGYRVDALKDYVSLPASGLEEVEALEQLRLLEHGRGLHIFESPVEVPVGVDTSEELETTRRAFE